MKNKEKELKALGFKRKWLFDKSGYWLEKRVKYKDFDIKFNADPEANTFFILVKVYMDVTYKGKLSGSIHEAVKSFPCNIKTIKEILKRYE